MNSHRVSYVRLRSRPLRPEKRQRTSPPTAEAEAPAAVAAEGGSPAEGVGDDTPAAVAAAGDDSTQEEVVCLPEAQGAGIADEEDLFAKALSGRRLVTSATVE